MGEQSPKTERAAMAGCYLILAAILTMLLLSRQIVEATEILR